MTGPIERSFAVLEHLTGFPEGLSLATLAQELDIPRSACHRLLSEMVRCGYVRQLRDHGEYALTTKLAALGLNYLGSSGVVDIAQPLIDGLAQASGELVRLAIVDGERLTFVAKAQGARFGLRYDPDMGIDLRLSCSAGGHAWLMTLTDEQAMQLVAAQGFGDPQDFGPRAPTTFKALLKVLQDDRKRGFSMMSEMYAPGMSAMGAPVQRKGEPAIGVITVAGPSMRLSEQRMLEVAPRLMAAADELAIGSSASPVFARRGIAVLADGDQ